MNYATIVRTGRDTFERQYMVTTVSTVYWGDARILL